MATPESESFIRSFARGLAVIEAMGKQGETHTVSSLAAATGLPRTVVRRVLLTLCDLGYAATDQREFRLTPKVLNLGMTYLTSLPFWGHAQRVLEDLCARVQESCAMTVFDGKSVTYVLRIPSRKILSLRLGVGSRISAYATSPGRIALAYLPPAALDAYLAGKTFKAYTSRTVRDADTLRERLAEVRRDGYAWVDGEYDEAICGLAVPVYDTQNNVVAALNVNMLSRQTSREKAVEQVLGPLLEAAHGLNGIAPAFLAPVAPPT
ncbi:IclR family transcriptional regulator [Achromobacter sp. DMS1]|uniref:IclR family transcriptional regulator domain-containing protein n=1 Tax=Achromobacter sp. DMS1 TaxID=1688405 RepID=UPI00069FE3D7|nr:IclR family transcriptional regulator C-terminal domain-containing protein [Achromobacter sp. DMS1]KOF54211.1 IclR family transcriptional regulator [Achromobacter sp. DMS1]